MVEWKVPNILEEEVCRRIGLDPSGVAVSRTASSLVFLELKTRDTYLVAVEDCISARIRPIITDFEGRVKSQAPGSA